MNKAKKGKKILIAVISLILIASLGLGLWWHFANRNTDPVFVYDFSYIGMTEYWGDTKESYGPISTDKIQTVYLSPTQTVTEILVQAGDTVKKGDVLMTFDTTLSDLSLERKRLEVEKLKLQVEDAYDRLWEIGSMEPMIIPEPKDEPEENVNLGTALEGDFTVASLADYDGSTKELALICWVRDTKGIDDALFETVRQKAIEYQAKKLAAQLPPAQPEATDPAATAPTGETVPTESTQPVTTPAPEPTTPAEPALPVVTSFYVIFKVTDGNMSLAPTQTWQGVHATQDGAGGFTFTFFDASGIPDTSVAAPEQEEEDGIYIGSGFTASQIAQMYAEQEKTIKDLEFSVKMAEADYKIMQTEVSDGNIYAQFDGQIVSLLTPEEATLSGQPLMKLSGGGGFYVQCSVSELDRDALQLGQEVTVNDWNTGNVYTGRIESVGDYPTDSNGYNGMDNPNVSYYPFTVFIDGEADFMEYSYVSVEYSAAEIASGIYLENPFLRTENGRTYVLVQGADGKLEKRFVTTGKSLWGSYTEVLSGITAEDLIAFPYGKHVREGADTVEGDMSDLYNY